MRSPFGAGSVARLPVHVSGSPSGTGSRGRCGKVSITTKDNIWDLIGDIADEALIALEAWADGSASHLPDVTVERHQDWLRSVGDWDS